MKKYLLTFFMLFFSTTIMAETLSHIKEEASKGNPVYEFKLGLIYEKGIGHTQKNLNEALKYYKLSLKNGLIQSYSMIGHIYYEKGNLKKAVEEWKKGANKGDNLSVAYLGMNQFNKGNYYDAKPLLQSAALKGIPLAQYYLAKIYENGNIGAPNIVYAYVWMSMSAQNFNLAKQELSQMKSQMDSSQLEAAKQISKNLEKKYFKK